MVEAAVVMPIVIMFFGLITFAYNDFTVKQETMLAARHKAFQNSLRSCGGGGGGGGGFGEQTNGAAGSAGEAGSIGMGAAGSALTEGFGTTSAVERKEARNSPISTVMRSRVRTTTSYVYCSPKSGFSVSGLLGLFESLMSIVPGLLF